jgi:hypothetical protein
LPKAVCCSTVNFVFSRSLWHWLVLVCLPYI